MLNPPNAGVVHDGPIIWNISRTWDGLICLRNGTECHPEFLEGMPLLSFVCWINQKL